MKNTRVVENLLPTRKTRSQARAIANRIAKEFVENIGHEATEATARFMDEKDKLCQVASSQRQISLSGMSLTESAGPSYDAVAGIGALAASPTDEIAAITD